MNYLYLICLSLGLGAGVAGTSYVLSPKRCNKEVLERGDRVLVRHSEATYEFYRNCEFYYIAGVATDAENVVFVTAENCSFAGEKIRWDVFNRQNVEKLCQ